MKKLRKHAAIAVDAGGIRGAMIARALAVLEEKEAFGVGVTCNEVFQLAAGTSTGSIISAGLAAGLTGRKLDELYQSLGPKVLPKTLRSILWPLFRYRYHSGPFRQLLEQYIGSLTMGELGPMGLVVTTFDLTKNRTRFVKTGKPEYADWQVVTAVLASCAVPTYFPPVDGQLIDGGVGAYFSPSYLAAYEACIVKKWDPAETTLISLGTGRDPSLKRRDIDRFRPWDWLWPIVDAFQQSAAEGQLRLVKTFFRKLDFRRFQVHFTKPIPWDDPSRANISQLTRYGEQLADLILKDRTDIPALAGGHALPAAMRR